MVAGGQVRDMRRQQAGGHIKPDFRDIRRGMSQKSPLVEPDQNIPRSFLQQTVQNSAFNFTQTKFHAQLPRLRHND